MSVPLSGLAELWLQPELDQGSKNYLIFLKFLCILDTVHTDSKKSELQSLHMMLPASYTLFAAPCDSHKRNMQWNNQANPMELPQLTGRK